MAEEVVVNEPRRRWSLVEKFYVVGRQVELITDGMAPPL